MNSRKKDLIGIAWLFVPNTSCHRDPIGIDGLVTRDRVSGRQGSSAKSVRARQPMRRAGACHVSNTRFGPYVGTTYGVHTRMACRKPSLFSLKTTGLWDDPELTCGVEGGLLPEALPAAHDVNRGATVFEPRLPGLSTS